MQPSPDTYLHTWAQDGINNINKQAVQFKINTVITFYKKDYQKKSYFFKRLGMFLSGMS